MGSLWTSLFSRYRAEEPAALAGAGAYRDHDALEPPGVLLGLGLLALHLRLLGLLLELEGVEHIRRRIARQLARQQIVARVAVGHVLELALLPLSADVLIEDDFHIYLSFHVFFQFRAAIHELRHTTSPRSGISRAKRISHAKRTSRARSAHFTGFSRQGTRLSPRTGRSPRRGAWCSVSGRPRRSGCRRRRASP